MLSHGGMFLVVGLLAEVLNLAEVPSVTVQISRPVVRRFPA